MTTSPKILAFSGSNREGSLNQKLVEIAAGGAKKAGVEVTVINLKDIVMPLFDPDLEAEAGLPVTARQFKELLFDHQGLLIASPEYNSSVTPVLKNAIDWASRRMQEDEPMLACFQGKVAVVMSTSPGGTGGLRGLRHIREILGNIGVLVLPEQKGIPNAYDVFNADGSLKDAKIQESVENLGAKLAQVLLKLYRE